MRMRLAAASVLVGSLSLAAQDVYRVSEQVTAPKPVTVPMPAYTKAAMLKRLSGIVELEIDVLPDGTVGTVALVKSLDPELDKEAVEAARKAKFTPGLKDGKPVTVRTTLNMAYPLRAPMTFQGADEKDLPGETALPK
jgi:TonB family protein